MKLDTALKKVSGLQGVQAAFVFDTTLTIRAREVPVTYSNDILKRIASQLYQLTTCSWSAGIVTQDFRLCYDRYAVFLRTFAQSHYLAVFTSKEVELSDLRQPINLAVLVLEKALRGIGEDEEDPSQSLTQMAFLAEKSLKSSIDSESSFVGAFRKMCYQLLGEAGRQLTDYGVEDCMLVLPLRVERDMRMLVGYVADRVPHSLKRQLIEDQSNDLIRATLKTLGH